MVEDGQQGTLVDLLNKEGTIDCLNNFLALAFSDKQYDNKSGKMYHQGLLLVFL